VEKLTKRSYRVEVVTEKQVLIGMVGRHIILLSFPRTWDWKIK